MHHSVIVYSTPTCPFCVYTKNFLAQNNIPFEDIDVSRDRARAIEMVQKSGQMGVPVIDINGTVVLGYQPQRFMELLNA